MYSRDPMDIRSNAIFINGVHGLAKAVVDGTVTPDLWVVSRQEPLSIIKQEIRDKKTKVVCLPEEGIAWSRTPRGGAGPDRGPGPGTGPDGPAPGRAFSFPPGCRMVHRRPGPHLYPPEPPLETDGRPAREAPAVSTPIENPLLLRGGEVASPGVAAGPVYLVKNNLDLLKFPEGAVLVTSFPTPAGLRFCPGPRRWSLTGAGSPGTWPTWPGNSASRLCSTPGTPPGC